MLLHFFHYKNKIYFSFNINLNIKIYKNKDTQKK